MCHGVTVAAQAVCALAVALRVYIATVQCIVYVRVAGVQNSARPMVAPSCLPMRDTHVLLELLRIERMVPYRAHGTLLVLCSFPYLKLAHNTDARNKLHHRMSYGCFLVLCFRPVFVSRAFSIATTDPRVIGLANRSKACDNVIHVSTNHCHETCRGAHTARPVYIR